MGAWTQASVAGKAVDLFDPAGSPPRWGLIFLHGVGLETLAGNSAFTHVLDELGLACACPHGQRSWWADRVCREFDARLTAEQFLLCHVAPLMRQRWPIAPRGLGIFGISMGGQGALRLAFKHPELFPAVAGIASAIDYHEWYGQGFTLDEMYDSKEQCRQDTAPMHVPPFQPPPHVYFCIDPADSDWIRGNDRLHEKLNALGVSHTCDLSTSAGGHSWDYFNAMAAPAIRFLHRGLEHEARRLL
jgi:S-formylglutathione hydrolase FrmB